MLAWKTGGCAVSYDKLLCANECVKCIIHTSHLFLITPAVLIMHLMYGSSCDCNLILLPTGIGISGRTRVQ